MNEPTQLHLLFQLDRLRTIINESSDLATIFTKARQAYVLAAPVPIDPAFKYKIEGKERTLTMLDNEIRSYEKSSCEFEVIQFQLASTILMLMLQFIEGSLEGMEEIIEERRKIA